MLTKLYRFELAFDGQPQNIGFLQGLDGTDIPAPTRARLYALFNSLPVHELTNPGVISCWFTEAGLLQYAPALDRVTRALNRRNWQLIGAVIENDLSKLLYRDEFQIMLNEKPYAEYKPITHAKDLITERT